MPKISIIVPVYNVEKYIGKCLESLVSQTFKDIEIIVVDDGSPDGSCKVYEQYAAKDDRIKIIKKKNAGVSEARNTGIQNASGDFLMFVDSDDWMETDGCEILYNEYLKNRADLIVADAYTVTNRKKHINRIFLQGFVTDSKDFIRQYQAACIGYGYNPMPADKANVSGLGSPWNKLYSRRIIMDNNLKYDPYVKGIYDDNLFTLYYLSAIHRVSYVAKPIYNYRIVTQSLTQSFKADSLEISSRIFEKIQEFIKQQENPRFFEKPFFMYVIRRLSAELSVYYFCKQNGKTFSEQKHELQTMLAKNPYSIALKNVEANKLMLAHKLTYYTARINWVFGVWATWRVRRFVKKLLER